MTEIHSDGPTRGPILAMLLCAIMGFGFAVALGHLDVLVHVAYWATNRVLQLLIDAMAEPRPAAFVTLVSPP